MTVFWIEPRPYSAKSIQLTITKFIRAFNTIFSQVGRAASENVVLTLLRAKCLPVLFYATKVCPIQARDKQSTEFAMPRLFMKIFCTSSAIIDECKRTFTILPINYQLSIHTAKFLQRFLASEKILCSLHFAKA